MKKQISIPESFDELTEKQFKYLLRSFFKIMYNDDIDTLDVQRDFAHYVFGRKIYIDPYRRAQYLYLVNSYAEAMGWIFRQDGDQVMLNYNTTRNLLPNYKKLVGPQSFGADLRFGEFRIVCDIMNQYNDTEDPDTLNALVGALYRKKGLKQSNPNFAANYREKFNAYNIDAYAKRVKRMPEYLKYAVYLWYAHFCESLISEAFYIEGREICFAPVFGTNKKTDEKQPDDKLGMLSILFTLADTGTFGNIDETNNAMLLDVMCKLLNDLNQAKNMQAK